MISFCGQNHLGFAERMQNTKIRMKVPFFAVFLCEIMGTHV